MDLDTSGRDLLDLADKCIENEDLGNARELIAMAIAQAPENGGVVFRAADLLNYAERYTSARKVLENHQEQFGWNLSRDSNYIDIVQKEKDNLMVDDVPVFDLAQGSLRFKRLSDLERGSLYSYVTTSTPVELIEASEQGLAITQSRIKYEFKWDEITRASIVARMIGKGFRGGQFCSQKICTLEAPGRLFQFDVSSTNPDFRGVVLLRAILAKYLDMEFIDERKPGFKAAKNDPIRNLKHGHLIRIASIVGGIILFILFLQWNQSPS
jgi:hypothetical protein